ncbi:hypothetical protein EVAR_97608_1 [Eumeta japonica]|uniref:Uncharacterized protein n=1 Tax=Eumeta variegata TaxID=151549 RepID=A0A4C1XI18_EUMVA|nr:hypothetical protein EVAR_97608_1 [Eumeta japonica]
MTHAALPRSEAFHLRPEMQARGGTGDKEAHSASAFGSVRHLSLSYLSERCVRVDSCYTIIHLHVFRQNWARLHPDWNCDRHRKCKRDEEQNREPRPGGFEIEYRTRTVIDYGTKIEIKILTGIGIKRNHN